MPFQEGFGAFPGKGLDEDRSRVGERHHEQGDLRLLAGQSNRRFAEIDLGLDSTSDEGSSKPAIAPPGSDGEKAAPKAPKQNTKSK